MIECVPVRLDVDIIDGTTIDLDLIKSHANIDLDDQDDLTDLYIRSAVVEAEGFMHRSVIRRTHRWVLTRFPYGSGQIRLPRGKAQAVTAIQYTTGGEMRTMTGPTASPIGTDFREDLESHGGGILMPARGSSWPTADEDTPSPVVIQYVAGYDAGDIPAALMHWIGFAVSDAHLNRDSGGSTNVIRSHEAVRMEVRSSLLSPYILNRWY